jgi:hypothetical protein
VNGLGAAGLAGLGACASKADVETRLNKQQTNKDLKIING